MQSLWIHDLANRGAYYSDCYVHECSKDSLLDIHQLLTDRGSIWCSGENSLLVFTPSAQVLSPVILPLPHGQVLEFTNPVPVQVVRDSRPPARIRGQFTLGGIRQQQQKQPPPSMKQQRERPALDDYKNARAMGSTMRAAFQLLGHPAPSDKRVGKAICAILQTAQLIPSIGELVVYHRNRWYFDGEASLLALLCLLHGVVRQGGQCVQAR